MWKSAGLFILPFMTKMTRLTEGAAAPDFSGMTARGHRIAKADLAGKPALLQFHRFATCPACFVSVAHFTQRVGELHEAGLEVVGFFYSTPEDLAGSFKGLAPTFDLVGDPHRTIFDAYRVERSHRKFLHPRSVATGVRGWFTGADFAPISNLGHEDTGGVPADFLIDADGILRHVHYGRHGADSMTVDEVLDALVALDMRTPTGDEPRVRTEGARTHA